MGLLSEVLIIFILYSSKILLLGIKNDVLLTFLDTILTMIPFMVGILAMPLPFIIAFAPNQLAVHFW
jgi:hypothetical protein